MYHPDKNMDKSIEERMSTSNKFKEAQAIMNKAKEAYNCFIGITAQRCSGRMIYDQKYDLVRYQWRYSSGYESDAAKEMMKEQNKTAKRKATMRSKSTLSYIEKCVSLFTTKGNQTNEWRIAVHHAVENDGNKVADIARQIRKDKGASGWDGTGKNDRATRLSIKRF